MSYAAEVAMIKTAHEMDMLTTPYVFNVSEAEQMARAGADVLVAHMGLTTSGSIGAETALSLDDCVVRIQEIADKAREVNGEILVLCHGGPIAAPEDARYVLSRTKGVQGFFGASSVERLPVEKAVTETMRQFKGMRLEG